MLQHLAYLPNGVLASLGFIFGLLVGSFLNVVIYRLPKMMMHQWTEQSREWLEIKPSDETGKDGESIENGEQEQPPTLSKPASHCGNCKTPIKAWQNIPLISYIILGGKCAACKQKISLRYPFVELLTGILSAVVVYHFGFTLQSLFGVALTWILVALAFIDFDHKLLPDDLVLPTLWVGLGLSLWPVFASPQDAIIGTIAGYLSFWIVFQIFLRLTGKEGMGYGDFKLMALLGAWLGWQYLPQIILISAVLGSIVGLTLMVVQKADGKLAIPFGPYIAIGGWIAMLWGDELNQAYMGISGL